MDAFNSFSILLGVAAVGVGIYEWITGKLLWRDGVKLTEEKVKKFLPYDVVTYIVAGIMIALSGAGEYLPFMKKNGFLIGTMILSFAAIGANVYYSNKILGKPDRNRHL